MERPSFEIVFAEFAPRVRAYFLRHGLNRSLDAVVAEREISDLDMAFPFARQNLTHLVDLHGITRCPAPLISTLDPSPSTPIAIMPSAMSGYWTSE